MLRDARTDEHVLAALLACGLGRFDRRWLGLTLDLLPHGEPLGGRGHEHVLRVDRRSSSSGDRHQVRPGTDAREPGEADEELAGCHESTFAHTASATSEAVGAIPLLEVRVRVTESHTASPSAS